jgi:hypothetical protein
MAKELRSGERTGARPAAGGVDKLAEAVTSTLGPKGRSVVLEKLPGGHQRRRASSGTPAVTGSIRVMKTAPAEMIVRELRADLAELINVAWTRDQVTFVTSCGRRVAAVVTVAVAEQAAGDSPGSGVKRIGRFRHGFALAGLLYRNMPICVVLVVQVRDLALLHPTVGRVYFGAR